MSDSHHRWLLDQLPSWEKAGVVSAEAAGRLRTIAEEGAKKEAASKGESRVAQIVLGGLGALLVGSGVLALIAHNWDQMPHGVRLTGSFALMAVAQGIVAWQLRSGDAAARWVREAAALFLVLAAGGCLALVAQIYNLGGDWPDFLLAWTLLVIPVMWVTRSHSCVIFHFVSITIWSLSRFDDWRHHHPWQESPCLYPLLLAAALVYWPGFDKPRPALPNAVRWTAALSGFVGFCALTAWVVERHGTGRSGWLLMLTVAVVFLLPLGRAGIDERLSRKPQVVLGATALFVTGFFCSMEWGARELIESLDGAALLPWCWVLLGLFVVFAGIALIQRRWGLVAVGSLALTPLLSLATMKMHAKPDLAWAFTVQLFVIGLVMIVAEFFNAKGSPRFGALLVALLIFVRMGDSELSFVTKAVVFIVTGLAFIAFNLVWSRLQKAREAAP